MRLRTTTICTRIDTLAYSKARDNHDCSDTIDELSRDLLLNRRRQRIPSPLPPTRLREVFEGLSTQFHDGSCSDSISMYLITSCFREGPQQCNPNISVLVTCIPKNAKTSRYKSRLWCYRKYSAGPEVGLETKLVLCTIHESSYVSKRALSALRHRK